MFETLEARRLMSVTANFADKVQATQSGSGTLTIKCGSAANNNLNVIENGISQTNNGVMIGLGNILVQDLNTFQEYVFYNVNTNKPVTVQTNKGNDTINFDGTTVYGNLQGGSGADVINVIDRGDGGTKVDGGNGNDT